MWDRNTSDFLDDYLVSYKINQAKDLGKEIDYKKIEGLFLEHVMEAVRFYEAMGVEVMGHSSKHVILLHERDATVMFIDSLVKALRQEGWKVIGADEAYQDPMYLEQPVNVSAGDGSFDDEKYDVDLKSLGVFAGSQRDDDINDEAGAEYTIGEQKAYLKSRGVEHQSNTIEADAHSFRIALGYKNLGAEFRQIEVKSESENTYTSGDQTYTAGRMVWLKGRWKAPPSPTGKMPVAFRTNSVCTWKRNFGSFGWA